MRPQKNCSKNSSFKNKLLFKPLKISAPDLMIDLNNKKEETDIFVEQVILSLSAISTVFMLGWVLWWSRYGIDFTDEGFYLVWLSNPFNYSLSVTQFGFIYHPLYQLLEGNIAALRQANILITFFLAWVLCNIFLKTVYGSQCLARKHQLIISGVIATASLASLVFGGLWLPTPSYNSLALQALLLTATGLLLADKKISRSSIAGWTLIGIGGWLAFMAKPTTAAALGLCAGFYLLVVGKLKIHLLLISLVTATVLLTITALTIDGSVIVFFSRLKGGLEVTSKLCSNHTLTQSLRLDDFQLEGRTKLILIVSTTVIFLAAYFSTAKIKAIALGGAILSMVFALASLTIILGVTHKTINVGSFQGLLLWSIPFAAILVGFALALFQGLLQISRSQWALAMIFLVYPHVYAFGTANNYWLVGCVSGIFWVLAGLVLLSPVATNRKFPALLLSLGLAVQLITVILIHTGLETPYRQPQPLRKNDYKLEIGRPGSTLILSKGFGKYIEETANVAKEAGFKKGTPMIDLTGQSPALLYAMGASNIGSAWLLGGYPGSVATAVAQLSKVTCRELAMAWLLVELEGPIKLSPEILTSFGAQMATDFLVVGTFETAEGVGGYKEPRVQQILKPIRPVGSAITACEATRKVNK